MNKNINKIVSLGLALSVLTLSGCALFKDKSTGKLDPIRLQQVSDVVRPVAISAVTRVVKKNPEVGKYFDSFSGIFCSMAKNKEFSLEYLVRETDKLTSSYIGNQDLLDAKNIILSIYKIYFVQSVKADVSQDVFLLALSNFFCDSIRQGLTDSGYIFSP